MNQIILLMNYFNTINFFFMNHPISMGLILLIQTILLSLLCGMLSMSYWYSYILFLIMIGGMLILFIYMTSLASNQMIKFSMKKSLYLLTLFMLMYMINFFMFDHIINFMNNEMNPFNENFYFIYKENSLDLMKLYNNPNLNMTILMIIYLLMTMIITIKISKINYGPLRSNY
uniref:NADH-ubiquinone oxidoreductase chain 6 n=1 Tax=Climacia areolaris TaxID=560896 RepID=A0A1S5QYQ8_9NEOP|nr:NADH dehydrogenase subunit 6 [Climacia areolaris]